MASRKLFKRCVLILGVTATSVFAATQHVSARRYHNSLMDDLQFYLMNSFNDKNSSELPPDFQTTKEIITMGGYRYEGHKVITEDGYVLKAHRILTDTPGGPPVIFQHGFIAASDSLLAQKENSLGFLLAEAGFDVWMTDLRGNWYSREHIKYKPSNPRFWDFSFHESGYYDLPAFIDKVLNDTGHSQVFYIGHSMGTTVFLVMASLRPDYDKKIKAAVLLAPVGITPTLQELSPTIKMAVMNADAIYRGFSRAGIYEFLPRTYQNILLLRALCGPSVMQELCLDFIALGYGDNRENIDRNEFGNQVSYLPAGSSTKTAHHLSQIYRKGFRFYDYGIQENEHRYYREEPPLYPLSNITAPVALYWGANDVLTSERAVNEMASQLMNLIKNTRVADPKFTHVDFVYGINSKEILYLDIIYLLQSLL